VSDVDELALPDDCDPARWPFCEARARAAAAWEAYPDPPQIIGGFYRRRAGRGDISARMRAVHEARRARQRAEGARTA
jgi:hypothetical protein